MTQDQGKAWNPGDPTPGEREAFSWGHGAGYEAGKAAVRAEIQAQWENVSRVFIAAEWAGKPTADARRLKRLATIQAAHEAGLHVASAPAGGPLYGGCPWCIGEGAPVIPGCYRCGHPVGMHTVDGCTQYGKTSYGSGPCPCDLRDDMLLAGVPHSRNYDVPAPGQIFGNDAHGGAPDGIGSLPFEGCDWPAEQCSGHYSIRKLPDAQNPDYVAPGDDQPAGWVTGGRS